VPQHAGCSAAGGGGDLVIGHAPAASGTGEYSCGISRVPCFGKVGGGEGRGDYGDRPKVFVF